MNHTSIFRTPRTGKTIKNHILEVTIPGDQVEYIKDDFSNITVTDQEGNICPIFEQGEGNTLVMQNEPIHTLDKRNHICRISVVVSEFIPGSIFTINIT